jgi:hypothetical protein
MMRNPQVAASISVVHEKSNGHLDLVQRSPYFDITRAASPMLVVSHDEIATPKFVFDYRYADRYLVTLAAGPGIDCANVVAWGANIPGLLNSAPGRARLEFEWTARYVLYFLDWKMKGGTHGRQFFARSPQENGIPERLLNYHTMAGTDIPPTPDALMAIRNRSGFEHMIQTVSNCLLQDTVAFSLSTYVTLGQRLFKDDGFEDGVRLASFIQGQFPHAAAGYALAGDCLLAQGKTTTAHLMYGKALEKLPNDTFLSFTDKSDLRKRIALRSKQVTE